MTAKNKRGGEQFVAKLLKEAPMPKRMIPNLVVEFPTTDRRNATKIVHEVGELVILMCPGESQKYFDSFHAELHNHGNDPADVINLLALTVIEIAWV